ncbi:NAD(P)H-binding protein, partial [Rhizobium johnstonii]|uniref:NAD(P)H-binding protein n=1 Tax=Rhizobium johnstonii TaxID=3019933 RepID=UPI003F97D35B
MATRVLFLGGTGVISSACVARAVQQGHEVTVLNRGASDIRPVPDGVKVLHGDLRESGSVAAA